MKMMFSEVVAIERNVQQEKWVRCAARKSNSESDERLFWPVHVPVHAFPLLSGGGSK
jgi:hypothetical protein